MQILNRKQTLMVVSLLVSVSTTNAQPISQYHMFATMSD